MTGEPLALHGCAPTPLASYLKALGVLRLDLLAGQPRFRQGGRPARPRLVGERVFPSADDAEARRPAALLPPRLRAEPHHRALEWTGGFSRGRCG